jgi:hypothetical protein
MDTYEARRLLEKLPGLVSAAAEQRFRCFRETKDGGTEEVTVTILDRGPESGGTRYLCEVTTEDGRRASGNASDNVQVAISVVHWYKLDR